MLKITLLTFIVGVVILLILVRGVIVALEEEFTQPEDYWTCPECNTVGDYVQGSAYTHSSVVQYYVCNVCGFSTQEER